VEKLTVINKRLENAKQLGFSRPSEAMQGAKYLRGLYKRQSISTREIAKLSKTFAEALNQPKNAFTHQAFLTWLEGSCYPRPEHRELLAMIFDVPLAEVDQGCNGTRTVRLNPHKVVTRVNIHIYNRDRRFVYPLTVKAEIDLTQAAIYERWSDMFRPIPSALMRHFGRVDRTLFGWMPKTSVRSLMHYSDSLLPLDTTQSNLKEVEFPDKRIWFLYLPDGRLVAGTAFREGRCLTLLDSLSSGKQSQRYPLSGVELIGYVADKCLFHLEAIKKSARRVRRSVPRIA
jgi:hypothetical protein